MAVLDGPSASWSEAGGGHSAVHDGHVVQYVTSSSAGTAYWPRMASLIESRS